LNKQKNICFFNTTKFWGGGEKWHFEAAEMMSNTLNNTFFVCDGDGELTKKLGLDIKQLHITAGNLSFLNAAKVNKLIRFYHENKIDTVIFNSPKDLKLGGKAAKKAGIKTIIYRRGIAVEVKKSRLNKHLFKDVVTHFIFNSIATKELLEKNYKEIITTKKIAIIYNAIEFPKETHTPATSADTTQVIIGNGGRLVKQKGHLHLINIAQKLKTKGLDFKILIAGEGPLHNGLKDEIKTQNLTEQIVLLGFVEDMKSFMQQIDVFVSTALWEGFGFVLAEAMVAKKPVLAFDLSSNPELVKDGENGFLIPATNIDVFADKLEQLINDNSLRKKMGEAAHLFAKSNFEKEKQFKQFLDFIA
jgi:glycosyltransferase involved in cell wall biosynthesis